MFVSALAAAAGDDSTSQNPFFPADYDIIWSIIPFALILAFFALFAIPRFRKVLDERAEKIEGGIARAEAVQAEAAAMKDDFEAQLAEARAEASRLRDEARAEGATIVAEAKEQAAAEAARIVANAHVQIEAERAAAAVALRSEVGGIALDLASGVIGESLSDDKKATALVERFLADLEASEKAGKA
jgi:F-type H+-transporting ATPase subunit b